MRWGIFADIHGNLEALQKVLSAFKKESIDGYLCLGDLVGYGANPGECIAEVKRLNPITIAGNHDWATVDLFNPDYFNTHAKQAVLWTKENLSAGDKQFLQGLELVYRREELTLVHASLKGCAQFEYVVDLASAEESFAILQTPICLIGHSHIPVVFIRQGENLTYTLQTRVKLEPGHAYIINVGSVGQPRDGNPQAAYAVYDSGKKEIEIKRVTYDIKRTQDKIIKAGLPKILAERLGVGR